MKTTLSYGLARASLVIAGLGLFAATVLFFLEHPLAKAVWPWPESRLSSIFVSSILAAIGAPTLWIGLTGELSAIVPGALNLFVTYAGAAVSFAAFYLGREPRPRPLLVAATACAAGAASCVVIAFYGRRQPLRDRRPMPPLVRYSFAAFALILVSVGWFLIARAPHVFPWPLKPEMSVTIAWIFFGAAVSFSHGFLWPSWANACGQLAGFLAYDLILIQPYLAHFANVKPEHRLSLAIYVAVIVYSALLAAYYLFVHPPTRLIAPHDGRA